MSVLPKGYEEPVTSNYMGFEQGENVFRILSPVIVGMEYWKTDEESQKRVPVRKRPDEEVIMDELEVNPQTGQLDMPRHFWAMVVWNHNAKKVQILEITQARIRRAIQALENNKKWGDAREYDITVVRAGEGFDTDYAVTPNPKEKLDSSIKESFEKMEINLEALYEGKDPFAKEDKGKELAEDAVKAGI